MLSKCGGGGQNLTECLTLHAERRRGLQVFQLAGGDPGNKLARLPAINGASVKTALARLQSFAFVGITDEWAASVRLFHQTLMPAQPVQSLELSNVHPTARAPQPSALGAGGGTSHRWRKVTV